MQSLLLVFWIFFNYELIILGGENFNQVNEIESFLRPSNISLISGAATDNFLSSVKAFPTFFRTVPNDFYVATAMVNTFILFNWTLIATVFTDDVIGSSGAAAFNLAAQRGRLRLTCRNTIPAGTLSGLRAFSNCIAQSFSNVVVLWMGQQDAANAIAFIQQDPANKRLTYIAPAIWATFQNFNDFSGGRFPPSILKGSIGYVPRPGDLNPLQDCYSQLSPSNNAYPAFLKFWEMQFKCSLFGSSYINAYFDAQGVNATYLNDGTIDVKPLVYTNVTSNSTYGDPALSLASFTYDPSTGETTKTVTLYNPFASLSGPLLDICPDSIEERTLPCRCTGQENLDFLENIDVKLILLICLF
jgi:Receptor family ligand binding region